MNNEETYTIKLEEGFPAFYTYTNTTDPESNSDEVKYGVYNDKDLFDMGFQILTQNETIQVAAVSCETVIQEQVTDAALADRILSEFYTLRKVFLCPNLTDYQLYSENWLSLRKDNYTSIAISISLKDSTNDDTMNSTTLA